jgi:hypothetical protein
MQPNGTAELESEIGRLLRIHAAVRRASPNALDLVARWTAEASGLRWYIAMADVVEADIDVEFMREVIVVRADRTWPEPALLVGILPVPGGCDADQVEIRFAEETLEVRVRWGRDRSAS